MSRKRIVAITLSVLMLFTYMPEMAYAADDIASGTSGTCEWVIDANGVLTISAGEMGTWYASRDVPWYAYRAYINTVVFQGPVKLKTCNSMFDDCKNIQDLDLSYLDTSEVTSMGAMFSGCTSLTSIELSNLDTSNITETVHMFYGCNSLTSIDVSNFDTSNVQDMNGMFRNCTALTDLDVGNFDTSNVLYMYNMFDHCESLTSLDLSNFDTSNVKNMLCMFQDCSSLTTLDVSNFDTTNVLSMAGMFSNCTALTGLDVGNFDTSNVTGMDSMFYNCGSLTTLDVSKFDTSNVKNMRNMFSRCNKLTSLDISNFDTSNVSDMGSMFSICGALTNLDLSNFDTSNVSKMDYMFRGCNNLMNLDVSSFDTSNVRDMQYMFYMCTSLKKIDISSFDISCTNNMSAMFGGCYELAILNVGKWTYNGTVKSYGYEPKFPVKMKDKATGIAYGIGDIIPECDHYTCYYDGEDPGESPYTYGLGDFVIGRDSNNFCNAGTSDSNLNDCGFKDGVFYEILDYLYYAQLMTFEGIDGAKSYAKQSQIALIYWTLPMGGVCYGVAATMSMLKSGALKIRDLTNGNATSYYQLGSPVNDPKFGQMVYYYVLSQFSSSQNLATVSSVHRDGLSGFLKTLVSVLQNGDKPYTFNVPKHTWIVTEVKTNSDGTYTVEMFDENTVYRSKNKKDPHYSENGYFTYMNISSDFNSLSFTKYDGTEYFTTKDGKIVHADEKGAETLVSNIWICDPDRLDPSKMPALRAENLVEDILSFCDAIQFGNNSSISLTNSEGETMSYDANDECISGDMRIEDIKTVNYGEDDCEYIVYIPKSSSYEVNTQNRDVDISLLSEDNIIAIKGSNINSITLDSDLNAVVEGESDGYTFDIASTVINENNEVGLDLINISGEASDQLTVKNSTESLDIQSDSAIDNANVVIHSDSEEKKSDLDNATTIKVEADNNITSDAHAHIWNDGVVTKAPTCIEKGIKTFTCSVCGETKTETVPAIDHTFSSWTTTKAATEIAAGVQTRKCNSCGKTETRTIAQLKPSLKAVKISKPKAAKKSMTVKWKKVSKKNLKKIKKIEIQYSTDKNFKKGVKIKHASAKKTSLKVKGLKKGKKYYVRIRAYTKAGGNVHVSKWSAKKSVKIK